MGEGRGGKGEGCGLFKLNLIFKISTAEISNFVHFTDVKYLTSSKNVREGSDHFWIFVFFIKQKLMAECERILRVFYPMSNKTLNR